jgi:hypothetical protein
MALLLSGALGPWFQVTACTYSGQPLFQPAQPTSSVQETPQPTQAQGEAAQKEAAQKEAGLEEAPQVRIVEGYELLFSGYLASLVTPLLLLFIVVTLRLAWPRLRRNDTSVWLERIGAFASTAGLAVRTWRSGSLWQDPVGFGHLPAESPWPCWFYR